MLNLNIVIGSTRDGRAADRVVPWLSRRAETRDAFTTELIDLREWALPMFAETVQTVGDFSNPTYSKPLVRQWNDTMRRADAFVFLTPEYNHSVPGVLKNAIDNLFFSFALRNKPAGLIGYSAGPVGGARSVEHLAHILIEAEAVPLRNTVLIPTVQDAFADSGDPFNPASDIALDILLEDLEWWGRILADACAETPTAAPPPAMRSHARRTTDASPTWSSPTSNRRSRSATSPKTSSPATTTSMYSSTTPETADGHVARERAALADGGSWAGVVSWEGPRRATAGRANRG